MQRNKLSWLFAGTAPHLLNKRMDAGAEFLVFLQKKGVDTNAKPLVLPYGVFAEYCKERPELARICVDSAAKTRHRQWLLRGIDALAFRKQLATAKSCSLNRGDGKRRYARDSERRKVPGHYGVHRKKAAIMREHLFEWFSVMRHSVSTRFPPKLVLLKAQQLLHEWVSQNLINGSASCDPPVLSSKWLKDWQMEYRVSFRRPNRKFKVPKRVLEERLCIYWANLVRLRSLALQLFGYELDVINLDQSPFHMNEAGTCLI